MIHEVTFDNFEVAVDSNDIVVLDFWAAWCGPCKIFAPVFEEAAQIFPAVFFGKVNTEVATDLAAAFQVRSIPTLMIFKKGEIVLEQAGIMAPGALFQLIEELQKNLEIDAKAP